MTLKDGKVGESYRVGDIELPKEVARRLEILGMTRDTLVLIINKKSAGSMIIRVRGTRFAIGKGFAEKITVS